MLPKPVFIWTLCSIVDVRVGGKCSKTDDEQVGSVVYQISDVFVMFSFIAYPGMSN